MKASLVHGWSFDRTFWDDLIAHLPEFRCDAADRGYFGRPGDCAASADFAIGHSLGALLLVGSVPRGCRGLIAINGFDRFAASDDWPGVPLRLLDRMVARFEDAPQAVTAEFRARCAAPPPPPVIDAQRLAGDLGLLREADARAAAAALDLPVLVLHAADDPILPPALRDAAFAATRNVRHATCADGGHLLPLTRPEWCAARIRAFAETLA